MMLVVILTVKRAELSTFRDFERQAAGIMAAHGGRIERVVELEATAEQETFKEVHLVRFTDADSFAAYRNDERLIALAPLRTRAIISTEILKGKDGPDYGALAQV
jgi:uncharacterized protein (DUF1330 family)